MSSPTKRTLLFLHARRTGGATLTGTLSNRFASRECLLLYSRPQPDLGDLERFRYVSGHVPISFTERFAGPIFAFTLLRDPVERALSAYSFYRTRPPEFLEQSLFLGDEPEAYARGERALRLFRECSIEEFIDRDPGLASELLGNAQVRQLSGSGPDGSDERLDDALDALERCDFVGLTERQEESAEWLARRLGWREITPLPRVNTSARLRPDQVSSEATAGLLELTALDRELYRHGVHLYERRLAEWKASGRPRDPQAWIPDAQAVCDVRFDEAIPGAGWVGREQMTAGSPFCWMGDTNSAWVDLASDRRRTSLVVEIPHVLDQAILETLRISVDGTGVPHRLIESDGVLVAEAGLERRRFGRRGGVSRVELAVDRSIRPCDVDSRSTDDRRLSIAVRRIALVPA